LLWRGRDLLALVARGDGVDDDDDLQQVDPTGLLAELGLHLPLHAEGTLGRRQDRLFERLDQHGPVDVLVFGYLVEDQPQGGSITHDALRLNSFAQSGTRFAFATSS